MIFPYRTSVLFTADGEVLVYPRPEVLINVAGPLQSGNYLALVDTGSDDTIFPISVARFLGIELREERIPFAKAFGGTEIELLSGDVTFRLESEHDQVSWTTTIGFCDFREQKDTVAILGHAGFLEFFTATFDGKKSQLTLLPNDELPAALP